MFSLEDGTSELPTERGPGVDQTQVVVGIRNRERAGNGKTPPRTGTCMSTDKEIQAGQHVGGTCECAWLKTSRTQSEEGHGKGSSFVLSLG